MTRFLIYELVSPSLAHKRFRIVETIETCDGPRSRLTDLVFDSCEAAQEMALRLEAETK